MKIMASVLLLCLGTTPLLAHDFWIQPARFNVEANAPVPMTFLVGHGPARDRWRNNDRIMVLSDFINGRGTDRRGDLREDEVDLVTRFAEPGLHVLGMQTNYAFSELPAIRFNDYAKTEGLTEALAERIRAGTTSSSGRERYSRRAKALIQVGPVTRSNQAMANRAIGLKLEIVTEQSPYALGAARVLPVRVLYNGRALPKATVKLNNLAADDKPVATVLTDDRGRARFRVPPTGNWQLNVVWTEPLRNSPEADFETTFSSLTFGYDRTR